VARRTGRLRRSLRQMAVINEIAHHAAGTLSVDHLALKAVDRLREGFDLYAAVIAFLRTERDGFRISAAVCAEPSLVAKLLAREQKLGEGICGYVATRGESYLTGNTADDPYFLANVLKHTRSELCVPLRSGGKVVGVLDIQADTRDAFGEEDRVAMEALADTLGAAVRKAELFTKAEQARAFTEAVIENITGGLIVTDQRGVVRSANRRACEILGLARREIEGESLLEVFPDAGPLFEFDPGAPARELVITTGKERRVPIGYSNSFFASRDGGMEAVLISFQDLSEVKALQRQVKHRERLATIGQVAGAVAHEVRNPLFGITSSAQTLARGMGEGTPERELMDALLGETRRLDNLVEQLLIYGRPAAPEVRPGDLTELCRQVLELQCRAAEAKGIEVEVQVPESLPALFDAAHLKAALLNLLKNALEAASSRVVLRLAAAEGEWLLEISDDGPGVPADRRENVFDLYFTTKGSSGTGMGLALCRKVARDHGGEVTCHDDPGGGALFRMRLPLNPVVERPLRGAGPEEI